MNYKEFLQDGIERGVIDKENIPDKLPYTKVCNHCRKRKLIYKFNLAKLNTDNHQGTCRNCNRELYLKRREHSCCIEDKELLS